MYTIDSMREEDKTEEKRCAEGWSPQFSAISEYADNKIISVF
jgi:hypothetical protein